MTNCHDPANEPPTGESPENDPEGWRRTQAHYFARTESLIRSYRAAHNLSPDGDISYQDFVQWLLGIGLELSPNTWRLYRNSVIAYLEAMTIEPEVEQALSLLQVDRDTRVSSRTAGSTKNAEQTSAMKSKRVPQNAHRNIRAYLMYASTSAYAPILLDLIDATLVTGLRPGEWATSVVVDADDEGNGPFLRVLSKKTTNGRGNATVRTLDLHELDDVSLAAVWRTAERAQDWHENGVLDKRMEALRGHFGRVVKRATPTQTKTITLYSYRDQFIANAKAALPLEEVAALVGHADIFTQSAHYGQRRWAWSPDNRPALARAVDREISLIHRRMQGQSYQRQRKAFINARDT